MYKCQKNEISISEHSWNRFYLQVLVAFALPPQPAVILAELYFRCPPPSTVRAIRLISVPSLVFLYFDPPAKYYNLFTQLRRNVA